MRIGLLKINLVCQICRPSSSILFWINYLEIRLPPGVLPHPKRLQFYFLIRKHAVKISEVITTLIHIFLKVTMNVLNPILEKCRKSLILRNLFVYYNSPQLHMLLTQCPYHD